MEKHVAVVGHTRREHQISLWVVVNHPPCGCWDLNSGSSEEQSVLLTAEPSLQPPTFLLKAWMIPAWEDSLPSLLFEPFSLFHHILNKISKWMKSPAIYFFELSKFSHSTSPSPTLPFLPMFGWGWGRGGVGGRDLHVFLAGLWTICDGLVLWTVEPCLSRGWLASFLPEVPEWWFPCEFSELTVLSGPHLLWLWQLTEPNN